jgi:hypothetical protein
VLVPPLAFVLPLARVRILVRQAVVPALGLGSQRQGHPERGAASGGGAYRGDAALRGNQRGDDRQAEPAAAGGPAPGGVGPVEPLEDAIRLVLGHAGTVILDVEKHARHRRVGARIDGS